MDPKEIINIKERGIGILYQQSTGLSALSYSFCCFFLSASSKDIGKRVKAGSELKLMAVEVFQRFQLFFFMPLILCLRSIHSLPSSMPEPTYHKYSGANHRTYSMDSSKFPPTPLSNPPFYVVYAGREGVVPCGPRLTCLACLHLHGALLAWGQ